MPSAIKNTIMVKYLPACESGAKLSISEDNIHDLLKNKTSDNLNVAIDIDDIFCALHTSGSTGKPKMSLLKHCSMINFITANQDIWENTDTVVSATIVTFDAFVMESVLSIAQGKQIVLASEEEIYNQVMFENLFAHSEHNMYFSTPTKIEHYITNSATGAFLLRVSSLVIGGEIFSPHLLKLIRANNPNCKVFNIYGPTECTICSTVAKLEE